MHLLFIFWHNIPTCCRLVPRPKVTRSGDVIHPQLRNFGSVNETNLLYLPLPQAIQRMRTEVEVESPGKQLNVEYMSLDLASLQATREFATAFKERHLPLHILVNNAGIAFVPFGKVILSWQLNQHMCKACGFDLHSKTLIWFLKGYCLYFIFFYSLYSV